MDDLVFRNAPSKEAWVKKLEEVERKAVKREPDSEFYSVMKPLLLGFKLFARLPYTISPTGKLQAKPYVFCVVYWILMYTVQTYLAVENIIAIVDLLKNEKEFLDIIMYAINLLVMVYQFYVPVSIFVESARICDYCNLWAEFEGQYQTVTGIKYEGRFKGILRFTLLITYPILVPGVVVLEKNVFFNVRWYHLSIYICLFSVFYLNIIFWMFAHLEMGRAGCLIKCRIQETIKQENVGRCRPNELFALRKLWLTLSKLVTSLGTSTALSIVSMMVVCKMSLVICSFASLRTYIKGETGLVQFGAIVFVTLLMIVVIVESAHKSSSKVGKEISKTLIECDSRQFDKKTHQEEFDVPTEKIKYTEVELVMFLKAISSNYPIVSLAGFAVLNRTTLTTMLGTIVTYLIVLVQFQTDS